MRNPLVEKVFVNDLDGGEIHLQVTASKRLRIRIWLATKLIELAGWVLKWPVKIDRVGDPANA